MDFTFNTYAIVLLAFGATIIILSNFIYSRAGNAVKWFSLMMLATAVWAIGYAMELASTTRFQIIQFINIEYIGVSSLPIFWFFFCLQFCGKECWYKKRLNTLLTLIIPVITIILVWTNTYHHLVYEEISVVKEGGFYLANLDRGPWYFIFIVYFYVLLASGCYLLLINFRKSDPIYRMQNYSMLLGAAIPWLVNMLSLLGITPWGHIDVTPFAFIITSIIIVIGTYRFKLFNIIPVARDKVLEIMQDGFLVLDDQYRVIDYNVSVRKYIVVREDNKLIGAQMEQTLPGQQELFDRVKDRQPGKFELILKIDDDQLFLEADILFLSEKKINKDVIIIKLQDLTTFKKDTLRTKEQATELEKLNQLKDRIFSIIAHDLRGPLVNLSEVLKMLTNDQISNEEFKEIAPTLSKDIIYTTDLLENILHWSRSQLKGFGIKKEPFNLRNLIINEINYHLPAATTKRISIIHDVFPGEMVYADILMIQIVMRNILNNAIKFCNEDCEIHITAVYQKTEHKMLVCIRDNGVGIPQAILNKLFKDENITTRGTFNEKGTGLGLMVCRDFMQRNDGNITVNSRLGEGSTFCITLPTAN